MHPTRREFLAAAASAILPAIAPAADPPADDPGSWAQFLGPRRDGISRETGLNTDWKAKPPKTVWKNALGPGFSSMAVVGDRVYTGGRKSRDGIACIDAGSGKDIWFREVADGYLDKQRQGPGPRSTPTVHQGKLYCLFPMGELVCLDVADGKEVWKTDVFKTTGAKNPQGTTQYYWGMSVSPLVEGDLVIVQPGGNKDNSLAAFDKNTGKLVWGAGNDPPGYSSPIGVTLASRRLIVCATGQSVLGVDTKGTLVFRYSFGNKFDCTCATALWSNNLLFVSAAYGTGSAALELIPMDQRVEVKEKWRNKDLQNQFATSVIHDGHIYGSHGDLGAKLLRCVELATGKVKWDDRRPAKCSLLGCSGHLIVVSENGTIRLLEANPERYVVKGELDGLLTYKAWPPPALLKGKLYARDDRQLICLDVSG